MAVPARREAVPQHILAPRSSLELWIGLLTALGLGIAYLLFELVAEPSPNGPVEHTMGIVGTALMLFTEVGYMARKRLRWLRVGSLSAWLSVHIVTGIVGPTLVLLHSTFKFHGLALLASALTVMVVASGFLGRYLYTAIPRSMAGLELSRDELESELANARARLMVLASRKPHYVQEALVRVQPRHSEAEASIWGVLLRVWDDWQYQRRVQMALRRIHRTERDMARQLVAMQRQVRQAERYLAMLSAARRLFSLWHVIHVPMGLTLFSSVFIHIVAVYYFGAAHIP